MDYEPLRPDLVYRSIHRSDAGQQLEHVFAAVASTLHRWCQYGRLTAFEQLSPRALVNERCDNGCLTLIEFDKLVNVVCRVWTEMFRLKGRDISQMSELSQTQLDETIRFRPPVTEVPGKHGPGSARLTDDPLRSKYVTQMLVKLSIEEEIRYVTVHRNADPRKKSAPRSMSPDRVSLTETVRDDRDYVVCGITVSDDNTYWKGFSAAEKSFVRSLSEALKHLGPSEVRALGTHRRAQDTLDDVCLETKWACREIAKIVDDLRSSGMIDVGLAQDFRSFASEAVRKTHTNRKEYERAYQKMLHELEEGAHREAFCKAQSEASVIWQMVDDKGLVARAQELLDASEYAYAVAYFASHPEDRLTQHGNPAKSAAHSWKGGSRCAVSASLPRTIEQVYSQTEGGIRANVKAGLLVMFENLVAKEEAQWH